MRRRIRSVLFAIFLGVATAHAATINGRIVDAETGALTPATVTIRTSDGKIVTDHPSFRGGVRSSGMFEKEIAAGQTIITVTRGFDTLPIERRFLLREGERRTEVFELRRHSPLRREGWYCGDNHDHMIHGERTITVDFPYVALAARAEGLDYLSVAQAWNLPEPSPEALERATHALSTSDFLLTWNLEAPKNYWHGDVSKCMGHGWTVAMRGRTPDGRDAIAELFEMSAHDYESDKPSYPNFESHALIHSLGGIVAYSHPCRWWSGKWGGRGIYPVEENKFVSNMAQELPFDTIAGPTYDTIDIMMQPGEKAANQEALKLWFLLLNHGYRIAATTSTDATFDNPGRGIPGRVRVYTRLDGELSLPKAAAAMKAGRSFVTSGPLVVLDIGGHGSGDVIRPGAFKGTVRTWGAGKVELLRNGEVIRTFDGNEPAATFGVKENGRAWYIARAFGANEAEVAVTNPIWFEPADAEQQPQPTKARVTASIIDGATGKPLDGVCEVLRMAGKQPVVESRSQFHGGKLVLEAPGTARLRVRVDGYAAMTKSIFMDYPPLLNATLGMRPEQLTDWHTFEKIRTMLGEVVLEFRPHRLTASFGLY